MIGGYVQAVEDAGMIESTIIVCAADHGDMQMEHQQFYKMVAFEASTRVPVRFPIDFRLLFDCCSTDFRVTY